MLLSETQRIPALHWYLFHYSARKKISSICLTSIFLASVLFPFLLPNTHAVYHHYISDKKDETIWHECSFLSLNNWQPGWQHCPPNVQCELWDKKGIDWDLTMFKAGSESKAFFLDNASAGFGLFSKTVSKNFCKIIQRALHLL